MSRLWAFTCIVLALGIGLIAGVLMVMVLFVLPDSHKEQSKFLQDFPIQKMLEAASPKDTQWEFIDNGSQFHGFNYRGTMGRRWLAECKMPNPTDQGVVSTLLTNEVQKAMTPYGGTIYSMGGMSRSTATVTSSPGPAGTTPGPAGGAAVLYQTTLPYGLKSQTGCVHITVFGQGDRIAVSVIVHEN